MGKILIIIIFSLITLPSFSQTAKRDSLSFQSLTDSTGLISIKDYDEFQKTVLMELPMKYSVEIMNWWNKKLRERADEWQRKRVKN